MKKEFNQIYQFKITLEDVRPPIWLRIQVPETYSFRDLHTAIQDAMGWDDYHLYEFKIGDARIEADEEGFCIDAMWKAFQSEPRTASTGKTRLSEFIKEEKQKFRYLYDFGDNWEVSFYSLNMSDVFSLNDVVLLLGWGSPSGDYKGIAICDPFETPPELTFLNEGLPNTEINRINGIELLEDPVEVYACTNSGVYVTTLFTTGVNENRSQSQISVFPNPVTKEMTIHLPITENVTNSILILNNSGVKVDEIKIENMQNQVTTIKLGRNNLSAGIYYLVVKTKKGTLSEKLIIL